MLHNFVFFGVKVLAILTSYWLNLKNQSYNSFQWHSNRMSRSPKLWPPNADKMRLHLERPADHRVTHPEILRRNPISVVCVRDPTLTVIVQLSCPHAGIGRRRRFRWLDNIHGPSRWWPGVCPESVMTVIGPYGDDTWGFFPYGPSRNSGRRKWTERWMDFILVRFHVSEDHLSFSDELRRHFSVVSLQNR